MHLLPLKRRIYRFFFGYPGTALATTIFLGFLIFLLMVVIAFYWPVAP